MNYNACLSLPFAIVLAVLIAVGILDPLGVIGVITLGLMIIVMVQIINKNK